MRGGTSKGAYFLAEELPDDPRERDDLLLRIMGSPDPRQIDGIGGAHPLTSKVAVVRRREDGVGYLFLQVAVDSASVSAKQNCGNLLAGVGPFAIERGLWEPEDGTTRVPIVLENTGGRAVARVATPGGRVEYDGETRIDGVPGTAAAVVLDFLDTAGSSCGALLPTGNERDLVDGLWVTCVDNGMPTVLLRAADLGLAGDESVEELEADERLRARLERVRSAAGRLMGLGEVRETTVPKMTILSPARSGGTVTTRTFIPHRCHSSIGVLGAASVAAGVRLSRGIARDLVGEIGTRMSIEHPTGAFEVELEVDEDGAIRRTGAVRTARPIMDGVVFPRPRR